MFKVKADHVSCKINFPIQLIPWPEDPQDSARFCQPLPGSGESCHNWTQVTMTNQGKSIHKRLALRFELAIHSVIKSDYTEGSVSIKAATKRC
jgi:hypothetical protein